MEFYEVEPTLDNYWRAIILFGRNVASYKFALAKALYDLKAVPNDLITLDQLAVPFSQHLCEHLKHSPKQITSLSSKFLSACSSYNKDEINHDELIKQTVKLGFANVIDAFHVVNSGEIGHRFFIDERKTHNGIRLTENFFKLAEHEQFTNFKNETEARWRLVEQAWKMGVARNLISVEYDKELKTLFTGTKERRVNITSCRDSLNGYQKGRCFYCYQPVSINTQADQLVDVDHFLPWTLKDHVPNINGVWNLVLSCQDCNRGEKGKFAKVPVLELLKRLHKRNEYFINSHLPLRETLIQQTGKNEAQRRAFLQTNYTLAKSILIHTWQPEIKGIITF
ncbi:HNH endonuclease domain-containing protein [Pseudoalteromonas sp. T1lg88]|uniref:HNH endonuclease domain-containing protein n=1 Tax=Pseudoalteromonas sp. T1lg88 TaxID=2077104 RepID=UPI000CF7272D|nr:HNH endonuclease domain-containing protein [Pseudoalteromonas sp. T1lg88]